jgi:hypothetical protein
LSCSCNPRAKRDQEAFVQILKTAAVDRVEFINDDESLTNRFEGERARILLTIFNPQNQIRKPDWNKHYSFGGVFIFEHDKQIASLHYSPEGEFSYGNFRFTLKGLTTNEILKWFKP